MRETNGGSIGNGEGDYQPRHAAPQLDAGLMEALADAADQYRYGQLQKQYDAGFAIIRARLFMDKESAEDQAFIESQRQKVAESIGRQAAAKTYADGLRAQLYYAPSDGVYYHGRHRLEDRPPSDKPRAGPGPRHAREEPPEPAQAVTSEQVAWVPPASDILPEPVQAESPAPGSPIGEPEPPPEMPVEPDREPEVPEQGSGLNGIAGIDEIRPAAPPEPLPEEPPLLEAPPPFVPPQPEKKGVFKRMRDAWYAGVAATTVYFSNPEKGRRRQVVAAAATLLGLAAAGGVAGWLHGHWQDLFHHHGQPPSPPQAVGPSPNSEQFFDTIKPLDYHGEPFEWTISAHQNGPAQATSHLLRAIDYARGDGLRVDTWGSPAQGQWGINSVTVRLPNGTYKSYYDTPRKFAILQWYAEGMGPKT